MSKVAATYWTNTQTIPLSPAHGARAARRSKSATPQWFMFLIIVSMTFMLCMAVNLRAYTEMSAEAAEHQQLSGELERLSGENLFLQEEVHNLKNDSLTIEREARRIGMSRPNEKILVPMN